MKTFYSILSAMINPVSGEKISLGLLLSDGNSSFFDFSETRLSLLNSIVDKETRKFIRHYLKSIENIIEKIDVNQDQLTIFEETGKNLIINEPYLAYLSIYCQNVISFSKPVPIEVTVNMEIFTSLFFKFIDNETNVKSNIKSNIQIVKTDFFIKSKDYYSIEKEFTFNDYKNLLLPITVDLFGKNEHYVLGEFFDLEKNINHIKNDYYDYLQINELFKKGMKFFISAEPDELKFPQQHHFWEEIRRLKNQTYVDMSELEKVEEYARVHGVKPA